MSSMLIQNAVGFRSVRLYLFDMLMIKEQKDLTENFMYELIAEKVKLK